MSETKQISQTLFAAWLAENQPEVFNALAQHAGVQTGEPMSLSGFTDVLSSIGSSIGNAAKSVVSGLSNTVKSVGSYLATSNGQQSLTALASTYAALKLGPQATVTQTQADRANAGQTPADIRMVWDAAAQTYVAVDANGNRLSEAQLAALKPSFMTQYGPWLLGGALALAVLSFVRK